MGKRVAWLLFVAILGLTACSHRTSSVRIGIVFSGGPNPVAITHIWQPGEVSVFRADGSLATSRDIRQGQTISVDLPDGSYRVVAHSGDALCRPKALMVSGSGHSPMRVVCDVS